MLRDNLSTNKHVDEEHYFTAESLIIRQKIHFYDSAKMLACLRFGVLVLGIVIEI